MQSPTIKFVVHCLSGKDCAYYFFLTNACREHLHISLLRYMADIGKAWPVLILYGGLLPLFLSVLWLLMIRHFVGVMPWITVALFNILIITVMMFYYLKAGWIGSDAISPIIGDHDPYIHVSGLMGTKSSSCCCDSHDICYGSFCPNINCNCSPNPNGNISPQGKYVGKMLDNFS